MSQCDISPRRHVGVFHMTNLKFKVGDYVVCPGQGHGVGQITNIETKQLNGEDRHFYIIRIIANGMTIMIPTESKEGVRNLVGHEEIGNVFELLRTHNVKVDNSTWNRRHREYTAKIKTGSLLEIADVLRSLFLLKHNKSLSFGERKLLEQCKELIAKEVSLSQGTQENEVARTIDDCFQ